jgi:hypothetical protein
LVEDGHGIRDVAAVQRRHVDGLRIPFRRIDVVEVFLGVLGRSCYAKLVLVVAEKDEEGCLVREISVGEGVQDLGFAGGFPWNYA